MHPSCRYKSTYDQHSGHTSLTVAGVTADDEGEYECEAVNCEGEGSTAARLTVMAAPSAGNTAHLP